MTTDHRTEADKRDELIELRAVIASQRDTIRILVDKLAEQASALNWTRTSNPPPGASGAPMWTIHQTWPNGTGQWQPLPSGPICGTATVQ